MKLIYTRIATAAASEAGTIANPDYYEYPNRSGDVWMKKTNWICAGSYRFTS